MTHIPARVLVALWLCATGLAIVVTGVFTQDRTATERSCNEIPGLVLDGGRVTTTAPPSIGRRPEPIPWRPIEGHAGTTTTVGCGL